MDAAIIPGEREPRLIYAGTSVLAAWKPHRMHCAAIAGGGPSLAAWVYERYPETSPAAFSRGAAPEGGLLHRLDFETAGLVLFARTPEAMAFLKAAQAADRIIKTYRLDCLPSEKSLAGSRPLRGCPEDWSPENWEGIRMDVARLADGLPGAKIGSRFRPYGPQGAMVACLGGESVEGERRRRGSPEKRYETLVVEAGAEGGLLRASVRLTRGFRHQIRAHFAWIGLPLVGDPLYGVGDEVAPLHLVATAVEFPDPTDGSPIRVDAAETGDGPPRLRDTAR